MMSRRRRAAWWILPVLAGYAALAYLFLPEFWIARDHSRDVGPASMVTRTADDIPGDPINVGLVGDQQAIFRAMAAAGWDTADAITLKTSVDIGLSVLFGHPYPDAPVSPLFYEGRKEDLAFEKPIGESADQRHHVRFWRTPRTGPDGGTLWLGSASRDRGVGVSHDTGQITHHIAPDVDAARDGLIADVKAAGWIASTYEMEGVGATRDGRNGGGDPYFTDGKVLVGVLGSGG
jgi:hypothetical protein